MFPPDGLLTLGLKHDVELGPHIIAPDPFAADDCLDDFSPEDLFLLTEIEEPNTMITGEDEPSSGLNGRLRPRKANVPSPQTIKTARKSDPKLTQEKPKRTSTLSKASPNKPDDLTNKSDSPASHILCPYCDKTFFTKQAISKHIRRVHIINTNDNLINCLFCNHIEEDANDIIRHMVDNHPNQYFVCSDCHTRFPSTTELAEHKHNVCEKQKLPYRNKLRPKTTPKKTKNTLNISAGSEYDDVENTGGHEFNGLVISCELKTSRAHDVADIEDNITTNFILPPVKNVNNSTVIEKNAVIILDDLQWNKKTPTNFSFHNTDADQILSRLGVVHRSPRAGDFNKKDWSKNIDESNQKFEKCFDTSFYSKVASNVQENLAKFLDGSFNFNPDPENTIKTRKSKNSVAINTVEGFPILLECAQFSRNVFDRYLPRAIAPKHKWKWDSLESDRNLLNPEQFKRDSHTNNCIISLVSSLDIWTQLCMRQKYEQKFSKSPQEKRTEKQNILGNELKEILESRELPITSSQIVKYNNRALPVRDDVDFPMSLGLVPSPPTFNTKPAVLSGEWVRPRCYVCCACGAQTRDSRALSSHISSRHPNAQIQHYEIVGDVLLKSDILKHLYVPPSQSNNRTRPLRGIKECTKCRKSISLEDLHQHMLDCAGDTPAVRRKCRYRPFGVRKRRPRLPEKLIRREMHKDIRTQHNRKNHMRPRQKIRTEVGDAETIRKMLADLPAKRHRVTVNPLNPILRPRRKLHTQRNKMIMKKRSSEDITKKPVFNTECEDNENNNPKNHSTGHKNNENNPEPQTLAPIIMSLNENFNNKPVVNKNKRKSIPHKEPQDYSDTSNIMDMVSKPSDGQGNVQIDQISTNNNSERIFVNSGGGGSYREHGNGSNNGSYNRDNNNSGYNEQQNNSGDSFAPSQNIPLKHSIASLTASSETHDKSVQFHHLFLVQQECNNVQNHVPSGQRMLFENEAIVTKLDKPPLHFNHQGYMDPQLFQKNKLNKPRKGLNDCIAMLKNKLEEPSPNILPGHVSVQCGSDEPLGPEPVIIERRHSATESNNESTQRSLQMLHPDVRPQNFGEYQNIPKRPTRRRSTTTRQRTGSARDKSFGVQTSNDYIHWKQYYYEPNMFSAQNAKRQPIRRKSLTPADELLLQHAYMNLEILNKNNRDLQNLSEYHYANLSTTPYKSNKKKGREATKKPNSRRRSNEIPKPKPKEPPKTRERTPRTRRTRANSQQISQINIQDTSVIPVINNNDQYIHHAAAGCTYVPVPDKNIGCCTMTAVQDENINVRLEREMSHSNKLVDEQGLHRINRQNAPLTEFTAETSVPQTLYAIPYETTVTAPLDLSNNASSTDNTYQYLPLTQFCPETYETYETLDLSNRHSNNAVVKETDISNADVVDLSLRYSSHPPYDSRLTPIPSDISNNEIEEGPTDLSIVRVDDYAPTDLSVRRRIYPFQSYDRTVEGFTQVNYIHDLSQTVRNADNVCLLVPLREEIENVELPTDLSRNRPTSRPDVTSLCLTEQQDMYLNVFRNNPVSVDDNIPADLSGRKNDVQNVQYIEPQAMNINAGLIIHEGTNRRTSHGISNDQMINLHYNPEYRTTMPTSYSVDSDRFDDRCHKIPNSRIQISPGSIIHDYSNNNNIPLEDHSISHTNEVVTYTYSDVPLSLTTNSGRIECHSEASNICNVIHCTPVTEIATYEVSAPIYTMSSEPNPSSTGVSKSPRTETFSSAIINNAACLEINATKSPKRSERIDVRNIDLNQELPSCYKIDKKNLLPTNENQNNKDKEINKKSIINPGLDPDPETARKIALLPKELVEILGTMPIDHRNQLLNVLPQYVSTSTVSDAALSESPLSQSVDENCSPSASGIDKVEDDTKNTSIQEIENSITCNASTPSRYPEGPHISLSSSVLLTPPTPQLSDRHSIQSQENDEIKFNNRLSRVLSEEDRLLFDNSISDKNEINRSVVKRLAHLENDTMEDSVIDLTGDDYLLPKENDNHLESTRSNDILKDRSSPNASTKLFHKVNNDKTASLRAVRIKTPSERNRSILSENNIAKSTIEKGAKQVNEEAQNSNFDIQESFVMQRTESSTDYKKKNNINNNNFSNTPDKGADANAKKPISQDSQNRTIKNMENIEKVSNENLSYENVNLVTNLKDVNCKNYNNVITIPHDEDPPEISNAASMSSSQKKNIMSDVNKPTRKNVNPVTAQAHRESKKCEYMSDVMDVIHICDDSQDLSLITEETQQSIDSKILLETGHKPSQRNNKIENEESKKNEAQKLTDESVWDSEHIRENKHLIALGDSSSISFEQIKVARDSNNIIEKSQELDKRDKESEKVTLNKQKVKRGRRPEHTTKTKYLDNKDQVCNQSDVYKKEINKENNYYSGARNKGRAVEESVKLKITEKDNERSSITSKAPKNIKETAFEQVVRRENTHELLNKSTESNSLQINAFITIKESGDSNDKVEVTVKQSEKGLTSVPAQNAAKIEDNVSEKDNTALVKYGPVENTKTNLHSRKDNVITLLDKITQNGNTLLNQGEHTQNFDISSDVDELTAPVRRSRRVKSQSLQNNQGETENSLPEAENKPPSTQTQLISSNSGIDNDDELVDDDRRLTEHRIYYESPRSLTGSDLDEDVIDTTKSNKRKKVPQSRRKYKKKRALTSLKARIDIRIERSRTDSKFSIEGSFVTNDIKTVPAEVPKINCPEESPPRMDLISISDEDNTNIKERAIEKRKSSSPSRIEFIPSSKPKKCKLDNDKESTVVSREDIRRQEKQLTGTQMSETKTVTVFNNTTCYNKPMRRIRSKSVVVKSSGVKLYDPYDIDFEDMAENTEPFIRKEISSKSSFTSLKTSTSTDNRNLSKTLPSAGIQNSLLDSLKPSSSRCIEHSDRASNSKDANSESRTKDSHSDTDESSKSDEPLKKYAVEKEKRSLMSSSNLSNAGGCSSQTSDTREKSKTRGKKKRTLSSHTKVERTNQNNDNDDELRSEQFMESFGFFSERKPRKSNLLATKKISETFHIIATENDEMYFSSLERVNKKSLTISKKVDEGEAINTETVGTKKLPAKRGRKKKTIPPPEPAFCDVCKKTFRRSDNLTRHQISLYHIGKLAEVEEEKEKQQKEEQRKEEQRKDEQVKAEPQKKIPPKEEKPNFLIVFKQQIDRLKIVLDQIEYRRKNSLPLDNLTVHTLPEIIVDVEKAIKDQILARRVLSRDEALFVDCCEMLKESDKNDISNRRRNCNSYSCLLACQEELAEVERSISWKCDKNDGDVDSITAKTIMESEEVRNLENDLISGLKEANGLKGANIDYRSLGVMDASANEENMLLSDYQSVNDFDVSIPGPSTSKGIRPSVSKDKMLPEVFENTDVFEDKFDKIKRKCRSQAAAAKQIQTVPDSNSSSKDRKKSEKKKAKRGSKKNHNTVPTKGALKGFDGIKVSIPKSDINLSAIVPPVESSIKKKKRNKSKKKKERKSSDGTDKYDSEHRRNKEPPQTNVDVYEFMDTEDTELFDFRPSTLMERFRSITNKELPSTSKALYVPEIQEASSDSGSDGDDFVYMSDDYVCSDDETENSVLSCEFGNVKGNSHEYKKPASPLKRKDVIEKNAVMGKIFKHNAVRSERRRSKSREIIKPKANLDQLFDSLLEDENRTQLSPKNDSLESWQRTSPPKEENINKKRNEHTLTDSKDAGPLPMYDSIPSTSTASMLIASSKNRKSITPPRKLDLIALRDFDYGHSSKKVANTYRSDLSLEYYARSSHVVANHFSSSEDDEFTVPNLFHTSHHKTQDETCIKNRSKDKITKYKSKRRSEEDRRKSEDFRSESSNRALVEEAGGVAVQRARRKCTVGKQNVLAESWSSESEPDGAPPRPNSVESVMNGAGRKKRGRKRETGAGCVRRSGTGAARSRTTSYWSDGEEEHEHPQQHGWIVGDSHKKLVTMLAHAKGRKRTDDKRSAVLE